MEKLQPKLRFPEFKGDWFYVKLKDVSNYFNGGSYENNVQESGKYELITLKSVDMDGNLAHSNRFLDINVQTLRKNTLIMILSEQSPGLLGMTALIPTNNRYVLNQRVAEIRPNDMVDSYFLSMSINRNQQYFSKLGAGTKVQNISKPNVENYLFSCPSLPEQTKIASFLTAVDEKLNLLKEKKAALEEYKKGMMQKIFSQEIRFKDDDGNDFADWEEKSLGEIANFRRGSFPQPYGLPKWYDNENGMPFIQVYDVDDNMLLKPQTKNKISELGAKQSVFVKKGTLVITIQGSIGRIAKTQYDAYIDRTLLIFQSYKAEINVDYFKFVVFLLFEIEKTKAPGGIIKTITKEVLTDFHVPIPSINEQTKIANFISVLDEKLTLISNQIDEMQVYKKGLLQGMFC
jgi:type I restriction enzyme S subunit